MFKRILCKLTGGHRFHGAPVPFNYGILIKKSKYIKDSQGFYHFHCNKCGLDGSIFS